MSVTLCKIDMLSSLVPMLSAQELLDCALENHGCNGGNPVNSFRYIMEQGLVAQEQYPYVAEQRQCRMNTFSTPRHLRSRFEADVLASTATVLLKQDLNDALAGNHRI
jgi:hypothetical protein